MSSENFDLFKLHPPEKDKSPFSWIECKGENLMKEVSFLVQLVLDKEKITQAELATRLASKLRCGKSTMENTISYIRRNKIKWISLCVLIELLKYLKRGDATKFKQKFIQEIEYLKTNNPRSKPIKAVKKISKDLAKILGAHVADGYLQIHESLYQIKIMDGDKQALIKLNSWFSGVFNTKAPINFSEEDNAWVIYYTNKVIVRYFTELFGLPEGKKAHIADIPKVLTYSPLDIKKEFLKGYLTFDAGVKLTGYVGFSTVSHNLKLFLENMLEKLGIEYYLTKNQEKSAYIFECDGGKIWLSLFEVGTEKWYKVKENVYEFQGKTDGEKEGLGVLETIYPPKGTSKICLKNVYESVKSLISGTIDDILTEINKKHEKVAKTTLYKYLNILHNANIIKKSRKKKVLKEYAYSIMVYYYNDDFTEWRIPWRPWLPFVRKIDDQEYVPKTVKRSETLVRIKSTL